MTAGSVIEALLLSAFQPALQTAATVSAREATLITAGERRTQAETTTPLRLVKDFLDLNSFRQTNSARPEVAAVSLAATAD